MLGKKRGDNFSLEQRMGLIEVIKVHRGTIQDRRSDTGANKKKQLAWEDISKRMAAHFPERPKTSARDLRELWRRMKTKAKALAREKKLDVQKAGGGEAATGELSQEIIAILTIIAGDVDQVHNDVDDDASTAAGSLKQADEIRQIPVTSSADFLLSTIKEEDGVLLEEFEEEKDNGDFTQNAHTNQTGKSKGKGKKLSTSPGQQVNPVLLKTTEALSFLKEEHEAKMILISLQQEAAKCKRRVYEAKIEYYTEKRKRICSDL